RHLINEHTLQNDTGTEMYAADGSLVLRYPCYWHRAARMALRRGHWCWLESFLFPRKRHCYVSFGTGDGARGSVSGRITNDDRTQCGFKKVGSASERAPL